MFVSQIPNNDPRPYRNTADGSRWPDDGADPILLPFKPRPEYDHTRDPKPVIHRHDDCTTDGVRIEEKVGADDEWAPRREQFDVPLNRVLQAFRAEAVLQREADYLTLTHQAKLWLRHWYGMEDATDEEIDHARRVLSKLVNVYGG